MHPFIHLLRKNQLDAVLAIVRIRKVPSVGLFARATTPFLAMGYVYFYIFKNFGVKYLQSPEFHVY